MNKLLFAAIAILLAALSSSTRAANVDTKADEVLKAMSATLGGARSYSTTFASDMRISATGMKQEMTSSYQLNIERPARLAILHKGGMIGGTIVSDGKKVLSYAPMFNTYFEVPAPPTLEGVPEATDLWEMVIGATMGGFDLLRGLILPEPYKHLMDGVSRLRYVGEESVGGQAAHHLRFEQEEMDWDLWVKAGDEALPLKFAPDFSGMQEEMQGQMPGMGAMEMSLATTFSDWSINKRLPEHTFVFTPPEGTEKSDNLMEAMGMGMDAGEAASPLMGEPAPDFSLELLDGGSVKLSDHRGKQVVLLDFWATWCGPCVKALPELAKLAEAYRGKDLVFFAVNQQEDTKTIKRFLEKQNLSLRVVLDKKGEVGDLYGVSGIPQTVLIDKDGNVADVHVGFIPGLDKQLAEKIDALLAK